MPVAGDARASRARRHGSRFIAGAIAIGFARRRPELVLEAAPLRAGPPIRSGNPGGGARVDPAVSTSLRSRSFCHSSFWNPRRVVTVTSCSATSCLIHSASAPRGRWSEAPAGLRARQAWRG